MQDTLETLREIYGIQTEEQFKDYENKAKILLTTGIRPSSDKTLVIVGGQPGAGKSRLIGPTNVELKNNAVIVDFDELRALHPSYKTVSINYPETTYKILQADIDNLKNRILQFLIDNEYNVIYEGALRNTEGFLELGNLFKKGNYNINMNIMAVPKLESYGSTLVRYAYAMLTERTPRWVEKAAHDESYEGVIRTVSAFRERGLADNISVFIRSSESPKKIYSTDEKQFRDAILAIQYGREIGRRNAVENFRDKYNFVKQILEQRQPELIERLDSWEDLYRQEAENFNLLKTSTQAQK